MVGAYAGRRTDPLPRVRSTVEYLSGQLYGGHDAGTDVVRGRVQPVLSVLAVALLAWALTRRLRNGSACPVPVSSTVRNA